MLVTAVCCVASILAVGMEWGSLSVRHQLVVSEPGTGEWQGVVALIAGIVGLLAIGFAIARGRGRRAALAALLAGGVIFVVALIEVVHLVTRPADIADVVRAGAAAIPLKGYRVPLIESTVGPGTWLALVAGALLALAGLAGVVLPAWRARR
jgi:uncharacterized membrane protein YkgB